MVAVFGHNTLAITVVHQNTCTVIMVATFDEENHPHHTAPGNSTAPDIVEVGVGEEGEEEEEALHPAGVNIQTLPNLWVVFVVAEAAVVVVQGLTAVAPLRSSNSIKDGKIVIVGSIFPATKANTVLHRLQDSIGNGKLQ